MTIFKVIKRGDDEVTVEANPLPPGEHLLEHGGTRVKVRIEEDDSVTVFLGSYEGHPDDLYLAGTGDYGEEKMLQDGSVREVKIKTPEGNSAVGLLGVDQDLDTQLALTPLSEAPTLGMRARR